MTWAEPLWLWLLAVLPPLAGLRWAWGRRLRARHAGLGVGIAALGRGASPRRAAWRQGLLWSGLAAAVVALAGPRWGRAEELRAARTGDLLIAIDCSRSMLATDIFPDRTRRARDKALDLVRRLPDLRVALLPFAAAPVLRCPLTSDHEALATMLEDCTPELFPASGGWQGTAIGRAVERAVEVLAHDRGRTQAILVVSDGVDPESDAVERAAARATEHGIPVYGLFIGDPGRPAAITVDGRQVAVAGERGTLDRLARATGAISVNAGVDDADVRALATHLERARAASPLELRSRLVASERYQWPAVAALLLLAAGWLMPTARRRAPAALLLLASLAPAADPWAALAEALAASGDDRARAEARLAALVEAHPGFATARYDLGTLLLGHDPAAAERHLMAAEAGASPTLAPAIAHNLALARLHLGRWEDALAAAEAAARLAPDDADLARTRTAIADGWRLRQTALAARAAAEPPRPRLADRLLPAARVDALDAVRLDVAGGAGTVTLADGASLPEGMRLQGGILAGAPAAPGRWDLALVLTLADGTRIPERARLRVLPAPAIAPAALPPAVAGRPWSAALTTEGLDRPRWQAEGLPPGVALRTDAAGAALVGTPAAPGEAAVTVTALAGADVARLTLPLTVATGPTAGEAILPPATAGAAYQARLTVRGDARRRRWRASGLPAGLALADDGILSGAPERPGSAVVRATAVADDGAAVDTTAALAVHPAPRIAADDPVRLRRARIADHALRADGGCGPLRWSASGGPAGVRLDPDGVVRGVPMTLGETVLLVECADRWGARGTRRVRVVVEDPEPQRAEPDQGEPQQAPEGRAEEKGDERKPDGQPTPEDGPQEQGGQAPDGSTGPHEPERTAEKPAAPRPSPDRPAPTAGSTGDEAPRPAGAPVDPGAAAAERWLERLPAEHRAVLREQLLRSAPPPRSGGQPW